MSSHDPYVPEPTAAERLCSLLVAASSVLVRANGDSHELSRPGLSVRGSTVRLHVPVDAALAAETARTPDGLAAVLEVTDVSPVAVRDRVRARLTLAGRIRIAHPATDGLSVHLRLDTAHAVLSTPYSTTALTAADLPLAAPDPLAAFEAGLLTHLADDHADAVCTLTRLIEPRLRAGASRVRPLAIDRYGIVLRLEHPTGHHDVRLAFPQQVTDAEEFGHRIHQLLAAARTSLPAR